MKYGKSNVLICEIMGFVRIFWKEQLPRDWIFEARAAYKREGPDPNKAYNQQ